MEQPLSSEERADLLARIAALDAEVATLSDFLENANTPLHSVGPDGVVRWANRAELAVLGYAREEYVAIRSRSFTLIRARSRISSAGSAEARR